MEWYKLIANPYGLPPGSVESSSGLCIPFDPANTDYQKFKSDVSTGTELQDPDGNTMSQSEVNEFLKTLP
jgi:hypothetical protein